MITQTESIPLVMRLSARVAWTNDARIAAKLHGFAMTEQGSALDMFRAAELSPDLRHRKLFLRHALDESRHARRFREEALRLAPTSRAREHERAHALPQDLYTNLGVERFLAFVHLSEARAAKQFVVLARHFDKDAERAHLARLFLELAREERFHVTYSKKLLEQLFTEGERARRVRKALARERRALAWAAWKRAGVGLGTRFTTVMMAVVFVVALPLFALVLRLSRRGLPAPAWHAADGTTMDRTSARRQA